jgi:hypothetical protein
MSLCGIVRSLQLAAVCIANHWDAHLAMSYRQAPFQVCSKVAQVPYMSMHLPIDD